MRVLTLPDIEREIEVTERDLQQLYQQRAALKRVPVEQRIITAIRIGYTRRADLYRHLIGISAAVLDVRLREMVNAGEIVRVRYGEYRLP